MKRKRHSPEQIVRKLRDADADLAAGTAIEVICKKLGVSPNTFYRWQSQYGGMKTDAVKRLRDLEKENSRLKKAVADLTLDKQILKEAIEGKY
jgi:transposase-like protein